jgi:glutamate--cysteine ligase
MRPYDILKNFGIEYVEVRGIDISPYDLTGMSIHQMHFLDLILLYCLIKPSPEISDHEKNEIDSNDYRAIYKGRDGGIDILIDGEETNIRSAKNKIIKDLKLLAGYLKESDSIHESIEIVLNCKKGIISDDSFHNTGLEKAKSNIKDLRSDSTKDIDSIKKEAELSLDELNKIQINSKEEMDEYVKNYNLSL